MAQSKTLLPINTSPSTPVFAFPPSHQTTTLPPSSYRTPTPPPPYTPYTPTTSVTIVGIISNLPPAMSSNTNGQGSPNPPRVLRGTPPANQMLPSRTTTQNRPTPGFAQLAPSLHQAPTHQTQSMHASAPYMVQGSASQPSGQYQARRRVTAAGSGVDASGQHIIPRQLQHIQHPQDPQQQQQPPAPRPQPIQSFQPQQPHQAQAFVNGNVGGLNISASAPLRSSRTPTVESYLDDEEEDEQEEEDLDSTSEIQIKISTPLIITGNGNLVPIDPASIANTVAMGIVSSLKNISMGAGIPLIDEEGRPRPLKFDFNCEVRVEGSNNIVGEKAFLKRMGDGLQRKMRTAIERGEEMESHEDDDDDDDDVNGKKDRGDGHVGMESHEDDVNRKRGRAEDDNDYEDDEDDEVDKAEPSTKRAKYE